MDKKNLKRVQKAVRERERESMLFVPVHVTVDMICCCKHIFTHTHKHYNLTFHTKGRPGTFLNHQGWNSVHELVMWC